MTTRYCGLGVRTWFGTVAVVVAVTTVAALGTQAIGAGATSDHAVSGTAWYAEAAPRASGNALAGQANATQRAANGATRFAKEMSLAFHDAASKVLPCVVMITNSPALAESHSDQKSVPGQNSEEIPFGLKGTPFGNLFNNPELRQFFKQFHSVPFPDVPGHEMAGAGSGVIVDPSGVILTNNHVVAGGGKIMVRLQDGQEFKALDIKTDPKTDLAVLRIEGAGTLPAARLGDSSKVEIGDWVLALGQPFGLEGTVTAGIVSAKDRGIGITDREDFIQTDAAINPGNSGGPLVDLDGKVIGINTAISSNNGGYQGVGFAIPANLAKWVGGQLETAGKVHRAYLGVGIQMVTQPLAKQFNLKVHEGVIVTEVRSSTPAAKAGVEPGDVILDFSGKAVSSPRQLQGLVEMSNVGSSESLTILRGGKQMTLNVNCGEQPADFGVARIGSRGSGNPEPSHFEKLGIQVADLTASVAAHLGIKTEHGVVITDVRSGSPADLAGLTSGVVITEANRQPVKSVADFRKALGAKSLEKGVLLLIRSAEGSRFVVIGPESE
ncbi:MAG: Do family serine endopeptidase [Thermoguttaceae bacterium]|jgi:serine protease Do